MPAADRAAQLRAEADTLDELAELEVTLLEAKDAYAQRPDAARRQAKQQAARTLRAARKRTRAAGVTVGGDVFVSNGTAA